MKSTAYEVITLLHLLFVATAFTQKSPFGNLLCKKESDCGPDNCCATTVKTGSSSGFCMPAKQLGDRCAPTYIYGTSYTCGCKRGLTCALVEINAITHHRKHRCVKVLQGPHEETEGKNNKTSIVEGHTAEEIKRLLKKFEKNKYKLKKA